MTRLHPVQEVLFLLKNDKSNMKRLLKFSLLLSNLIAELFFMYKISNKG